jgi:mono/diheme cytochrome c family protein
VTRTSFISRVALLLASALAAPVALTAQDTTTSPAAVAAQQVDIGEQWFRARCLECHAVGALSNADFRLKWAGKNAFELYEQIRKTMPEEAPGSLTGPTYVSIVAYLIKQNGMPVGTALPSDSSGLAGVRLSFPASATSSSKR